MWFSELVDKAVYCRCQVRLIISHWRYLALVLLVTSLCAFLCRSFSKQTLWHVIVVQKKSLITLTAHFHFGMPIPSACQWPIMGHWHALLELNRTVITHVIINIGTFSVRRSHYICCIVDLQQSPDTDTHLWKAAGKSYSYTSFFDQPYVCCKKCPLPFNNLYNGSEWMIQIKTPNRMTLQKQHHYHWSECICHEMNKSFFHFLNFGHWLRPEFLSHWELWPVVQIRK